MTSRTYCSLLAKAHGAKRAIALVDQPVYVTLSPSLGIDVCISPRLATASAILTYVRQAEVVSMAVVEQSDSEVIEFSLPASSSILHRPLKSLAVPEGSIVGGICAWRRRDCAQARRRPFRGGRSRDCLQSSERRRGGRQILLLNPAMNIRLTLRILGGLLIFLGVMLLTPIPFALIHHRPDSWHDGAFFAFVLSALLTISSGAALCRYVNAHGEMTYREGFGVVTFGWIAFALFGSLPFLLADVTGVENPADAYFEAMSAFEHHWVDDDSAA